MTVARSTGEDSGWGPEEAQHTEVPRMRLISGLAQESEVLKIIFPRV